MIYDYHNLLNDDGDDYDITNLTQEALEMLLKAQFEAAGCSCGTKYHWCAISRYAPQHSNMIYGTSFMSGKPTESVLRSKFLAVAATAADNIGVTWNPFDVSLCVKRAKGLGAI